MAANALRTTASRVIAVNRTHPPRADVLEEVSVNAPVDDHVHHEVKKAPSEAIRLRSKKTVRTPAITTV